MRWTTVAICEMCWRDEEPGREPVRMRDCMEHCYRCGHHITDLVIYARRQVP